MKKRKVEEVLGSLFLPVFLLFCPFSLAAQYIRILERFVAVHDDFPVLLRHPTCVCRRLLRTTYRTTFPLLCLHALRPLWQYAPPSLVSELSSRDDIQGTACLFPSLAVSLTLTFVYISALIRELYSVLGTSRTISALTILSCVFPSSDGSLRHALCSPDVNSGSLMSFADLVWSG
ncbi:hypothetical protein BDZ91DRAFT_228313 [Kalaharituber pfeilii]|nr:hypothetical protein BDZ91DRAFT_228313 [Kalaharituber pfeilii]